MIKAIIFDFDGLIMDTETSDYESWRKTYVHYGAELPLDTWLASIGSVHLFDPYQTLETQLGHPVNRNEVQTMRRKWEVELLAETGVLPGVETYLDEARQIGLAIGLASSSDHGWVDNFLRQLGLYNRFDTICCRDDVENRSKPDPAVYAAAVSALGVLPNQALALEDSANGVLAAKHAGLWCTAVPNQMTRSLNFDHADYRLNSLAEMPLSQLINEVTNGKE
jgi:HAD superfamily hydrolase (TIGR01509 family)